MLMIRDLGAWLPQEVMGFYEGKGLSELYPPQAEAIERGLLDGRNMVLAMPTASGKTLLAELVMLKAALQGRRSLYIVPLRALASEKYEAFREFRSLSVSVGISTGDFERRDERLGRNHIIVATSEKADSLMRNGASWVRDLSVLVIDEIHLLNDSSRGPTLEMTITKLRRLNPEIQIIGLSATVANGQEIAGWLSAELVYSDWRPVQLREGIACGGRLIFPDGEADLGGGKDDATSLVRDTLTRGAQILIFESSRRNAEAAASRLCSLTEGTAETRALSEIILSSGESETCRRLASCVEHGVAFHHAGLLPEHRRLVEKGFRENRIKVIASTPTLAAGLNLPARRVLIKSYRRYEYGSGMVPIPVIEYRQMAGRAGRPGLDPYGEAFLIARDPHETRELMERYVLGSPEEISSKLASESALRAQILSTISSGFASSWDEIREFFATTFYAQQQDPWRLDATLEGVLSFLEEQGMISESSGAILPTRLGSLVSRLYIDPLSAVIMKEMIQSRKGSVGPTDLGLMHLITMTPDMDLLYVQSADGWLEGFIEEHRDELMDEENYDFLLREVKTASMLMDWIGEVKEEQISDRYRIGPGDIRRLAETSEWLMHSLSEISRRLELGVTFRTEQLSRRIHYGAGQDLLELLDIKGIGRVRARKLFSAGIRSLDGLRSADPAELSRILGPKIAESVVSQLESWGRVP